MKTPKVKNTTIVLLFICLISSSIVVNGQGREDDNDNYEYDDENHAIEDNGDENTIILTEEEYELYYDSLIPANYDPLPFDNQENMKTERGVAVVSNEFPDNLKYVGLHKSLPTGTIVKVKNDANENSVFIRIVGTLSGSNEAPPNTIIEISKAVQERLKSNEEQLDMETERGVAVVSNEFPDNLKYVGLHKSLPTGTMVKVKNDANGNSVYIRIVGTLSGSNEAPPNTIIEISKAAQERLKSNEEQLDMKTERGVAVVSNEFPDNLKYAGLHKSLPTGTIVKVKNDANENSVYIGIVGTLSGSNEAPPNTIIEISKAAQERLKSNEEQLDVEITYRE